MKHAMKHRKARLKREQPRRVLVLMLAGTVAAATTAVVVSVLSPNPASATTVTFSVGNNQTFIVPPGVNQLSVTAIGAGGGAGGSGNVSGVSAPGGTAGGGATVGTPTSPRTIPVTPGDTLQVNVGGRGAAGGTGTGGTAGSSFKAAGGGGLGGTSGTAVAGSGGGGGGASSIIDASTSAVLIVAGGGGGGGGGGTIINPSSPPSMAGGNGGTAGGTGSTAPTAGQHPTPVPAESSGNGSNCASTTAGTCSTIGGGGAGTPNCGTPPSGAPANSCMIGAGGGGGGTGAGYNGVVNTGTGPPPTVQGNGQGGGAGLGGATTTTPVRTYGGGGGGGGGGASWLVNASGVGALTTPNSFTNAGDGSVTITYFTTTTTLTSSATQAAPGVPVTLTATVTAPESGSTLPANSTVTFFSDGTAIAGCTAVSIGTTAGTPRTVTCNANTTTNPLPAGARTITAVYNGSASTSTPGNIAGSTSNAVSLLIGPSTTTLTSTPNPSNLGQSVTLTANVTSQGASSFTPTGTVTFLDGGTPIPGCESVALSSSPPPTATCTTTGLAGGTHALTAVYSGDSHFGSSVSNTVTQTVIALNGTITNNANGLQLGSVGLTETHGSVSCSAAADGLWHNCATINKYSGGTLTIGASTSTTVTLENTGSVSATLFLLPSACSDSLTGAGGALCGDVDVTVSCDVTPTFTFSPGTLNAFHAAAKYPTGIAVGPVPPGPTGTVSCTFDVEVPAGTTITTAGTLSQPIAWRLQAP